MFAALPELKWSLSPLSLFSPGCQRNNYSTIQDFHLHSDKGYLGNLVPPISHYGESYEAEIKFCSRWLWGEGRWKAVHSNDPVGKCVFLHVCVCAVASACTSAFLFKAAFLCALQCFICFCFMPLWDYITRWKCSVRSWRKHTDLLISSKLPAQLWGVRNANSDGRLSATYLRSLLVCYFSWIHHFPLWLAELDPHM